MTLRECYESLGGSLDDVLSRLPSEDLVKKFAIKFLDDPSYGDLVKGIETGDAELAFRAAHTLKGVCQNLSLDRLYVSAHNITEALRDKQTLDGVEGLEELANKVKEDYELTVNSIKELS